MNYDDFFQVIDTDENSMERNHRSMLFAVLIRRTPFALPKEKIIHFLLFS